MREVLVYQKETKETNTKVMEGKKRVTLRTEEES